MSHGNIVWEWGIPRTYQGYFDLGPVAIPPTIEQIAVTDGTTGTMFLVSIDPNGFLGFDTNVPQRLLDRTGKTGPASDVQVYPASDGLPLGRGLKLTAGTQPPGALDQNGNPASNPWPCIDVTQVSAMRPDQGGPTSLVTAAGIPQGTFIRVPNNSSMYGLLSVSPLGFLVFTPPQAFP
jgi:hypothetical protein